MSNLFNLLASEDEKNYLQAYYDVKSALESFRKLNTNQQKRLLNEVSIEMMMKAHYQPYYTE